MVHTEHSIRGLEVRGKWGHHQPKPEGRAPKVWVDPVTDSAADADVIKVQRSTPQYPENICSSLEILPASRWLIRIPEIGFLPIPAPQATSPLPDVAAHLFAAVGANPTGETAHGAGRLQLGILIVGPVWIGLVAPGIAARLA